MYRLILLFLLSQNLIFAQNLKEIANEQILANDEKVLETIQKIQKNEGLTSDVLLLEAKYFSNIGEFNKSNIKASKGLLFKQNPNKSEFEKILMINYYLTGSLDSCIYYGNEMLKGKLPQAEIAKARVLLANVHWTLGNEKYAEEGYNIAANISRKIGDNSSYAAALNGLGLIYFESKKNDTKALNFFLNAIKYVPQEQEMNKANYEVNISGVYIELNKLDSALIFLKRSEKIAAQFNDNELLFSCFVNQGVIYHRKKNLQLSEFYLKRAEKIANDNKINSTKIETVYSALSDLAYLKGNYKLSVDYLQKYFYLFQERTNEEKNKGILLLQEQFETSEKKNEIAELKLQQERAKLEQSTLLNNFFKMELLVVALILLIFIVVFSSYVFFRIRKSKLEKLSSIQRRKAIIEAIEDEKSRFSRELHDDIGSSITSVRLHLHNLTLDKIEKDAINNKLIQISKNVKRISNDLMPIVLQKLGLESSIQQLCIDLNTSSHLNIQYSSNIYSAFELTSQQSLTIFRIFQEIMNNIIKHSKANKIEIVFSHNAHKLIISIVDNGIGFNPKENIHTTSTGHGLLNIENRLQYLKTELTAEITYEKNKTQGTITILKLEHEKSN